MRQQLELLQSIHHPHTDALQQFFKPMIRWLATFITLADGFGQGGEYHAVFAADVAQAILQVLRGRQAEQLQQDQRSRGIQPIQRMQIQPLQRTLLLAQRLRQRLQPCNIAQHPIAADLSHGGRIVSRQLQCRRIHITHVLETMNIIYSRLSYRPGTNCAGAAPG